MQVVYRDTRRRPFLFCFGISLLLAAGGVLNRPIAPLAFGLAIAVTLAAFLLFLRRTLVLVDGESQKAVVLLQRPLGNLRREISLESLRVLLVLSADGGRQSLWRRSSEGGRLLLTAGDGPRVAPLGQDLARQLGRTLDVVNERAFASPDP